MTPASGTKPTYRTLRATRTALCDAADELGPELISVDGGVNDVWCDVLRDAAGETGEETIRGDGALGDSVTA